MKTTKRIIKGIEEIPELYVLGNPIMSVLSFTSDGFNVFQLGDLLDEKGWHLDRIQFPTALHIMVNPHHADIVDTFLQDLRDAVVEIRKNPDKIKDGEAAMYGLISSLPDRGKVKDFVLNFLKDQYKIQ